MIRILVIHSDFSSAHFYKNDKFSQTENKKHFGRCYTPFGHGHNYHLELGFIISEDQKSVSQLNLKLKKKIQQLTEKLDHEHLNFVIPEFKKTIPTTENILLYFEKQISNLGLPFHVGFIKLFESENLWSQKYYVTI